MSGGALRKEAKERFLKEDIKEGTQKVLDGSDDASSLSDKIFLVECANDKHGRLRKSGSVGNNKRKRLYFKDVKEFVKIMRRYFCICDEKGICEHCKEIDKIFGSALI